MIRLGPHLEFISISGPTVAVPLATPKGFPQTPGPSGLHPHPISTSIAPPMGPYITGSLVHLL